MTQVKRFVKPLFTAGVQLTRLGSYLGHDYTRQHPQGVPFGHAEQLGHDQIPGPRSRPASAPEAVLSPPPPMTGTPIQVCQGTRATPA